MSTTTEETSKEDVKEGEEELSLDCPICLQPCIHPVELPCSHIFCFLCIKGVAMQGPQGRCAICRSTIPPSVLTNPRLKDVSQLYKHTKADYEWFYEARNGGWWQYDERNMQELERAFETGQGTCQLLIAGHLYDIDFSQMVQYRVNNRNMARRIKRDAASVSAEKRGIAGIRLGADRMETENVATPVVNQRRRRHDATSQAPAQPNNAIPPPPSSGGDSVLASVQMANAESDDDEDHEGDDEGVDSDPDLDGLDEEEEDDEMDLGEEEELEESDPSEGEEGELRDGARAPTRHSERSNSSTTHTPPPNSAVAGQGASGVLRNCNSSSPSSGLQNGRSSARGRPRNGRRSSNGALVGGNQLTGGKNGDMTGSISTSPSPQLLVDGGIRTLSGSSIRLSSAVQTQNQSQIVPCQEESPSTTPVTTTRATPSSITTTSGITCLLIGPGVRITVDREQQPGNGASDEEIL